MALRAPKTATAVLFGLLLRPLLDALVRWLQRRRIARPLALPPVVWRVSAKSFPEEAAPEALPWITDDDDEEVVCPNCEAAGGWGGGWTPEKAMRLHAALAHVWFASEGQRRGRRPDRPDRCCSATADGAYAAVRAAARGSVPEEDKKFQLHMVMIAGSEEVVARDCRSLRLEQQLDKFSIGNVASSCLGRHHRDAGNYTVDWGERLAEVLLDRTKIKSAAVVSRAVADLPQSVVAACQQAMDAARRAEALGAGSAWCLGLDGAVAELVRRMKKRRAEGKLIAWMSGGQ
jgi:hypothetical protein